MRKEQHTMAPFHRIEYNCTSAPDMHEQELVTYLELLFEKGKDDGRDYSSNTATVDAQNGDQLDLFRIGLVCTFCRISVCHLLI